MPDNRSAQHINRLTVRPFIQQRFLPDDWLTANRISPCRQIPTAAIRFAGLTEVSFFRMTVKPLSSQRDGTYSDRLLV
jgi:hypothetical protein